MKKQPDKGKITALYERLSHDDERSRGKRVDRNQSAFWRTTPKRTALRISGTSPMTECGERLSSVRGWTLCWKKSGREMWLRSLSKTKAGLAVMLSKWGFEAHL